MGCGGRSGSGNATLNKICSQIITVETDDPSHPLLSSGTQLPSSRQENSPFLSPRRHISGTQNSILEWHLDVGLSMRQMREEGWLTSLSPEDPDHPSLFSMPGPPGDGMAEEEEWKPRDPSMMTHSFSHLECQGSQEREGSIGVLVNTEWATSLLCYRPDKLRPSERKAIDIGTHRVTSGQEVTELLPTTYFFWSENSDVRTMIWSRVPQPLGSNAWWSEVELM